MVLATAGCLASGCNVLLGQPDWDGGYDASADDGAADDGSVDDDGSVGEGGLPVTSPISDPTGGYYDAVDGGAPDPSGSFDGGGGSSYD